MELADLEARSKKLDSIADKVGGPISGLRLDILVDVAEELNANLKLREIFGDPVISKLGVVAAMNDLKIVEAQLILLTAEQKEIFISELTQTLASHSATEESQYEE
ncbi:MAG: hypothetical protein ABH950_05355 [Candidatus Altiarchaeota archaeon]